MDFHRQEAVQAVWILSGGRDLNGQAGGLVRSEFRPGNVDCSVWLTLLLKLNCEEGRIQGVSLSRKLCFCFLVVCDLELSLFLEGTGWGWGRGGGGGGGGGGGVGCGEPWLHRD